MQGVDEDAGDACVLPQRPGWSGALTFAGAATQFPFRMATR